MLESSEILVMIDCDALTAVDRADDLSVAGDDAYTCPIEHAPYAAGGGVVGDSLIGQLHVRGHAPGHRHTKDTALHEPRPLARFIDRMLQGYFVFAI